MPLSLFTYHLSYKQVLLHVNHFQLYIRKDPDHRINHNTKKKEEIIRIHSTHTAPKYKP